MILDVKFSESKQSFNSQFGELQTIHVKDDLTIINGTVISPNADYAEVGEWSDGNPDGENRIGYFVSVFNTESGITMIKATSTSDVRGVTIESPAFAANASADKYDTEKKLLKQYDYVGFVGFCAVIDNGTCEVNGKCMPADDGTAIPSSNNMGYRVISRIDDSTVLILVEPQGDGYTPVKGKDYFTDADKSEMVSSVISQLPVYDGSVTRV